VRSSTGFCLQNASNPSGFVAFQLANPEHIFCYVKSTEEQVVPERTLQRPTPASRSSLAWLGKPHFLLVTSK